MTLGSWSCVECWCWWPGICISSEEENLTLSSDCINTVVRWSGLCTEVMVTQIVPFSNRQDPGHHHHVAETTSINMIHQLQCSVPEVSSWMSQTLRVEHKRFPLIPHVTASSPCPTFSSQCFAVIRLLQLCRVVCHSFSPVDVSGPVPT